jgi:hypothetical protein
MPVAASCENGDATEPRNEKTHLFLFGHAIGTNHHGVITFVRL